MTVSRPDPENDKIEAILDDLRKGEFAKKRQQEQKEFNDALEAVGKKEVEIRESIRVYQAAVVTDINIREELKAKEKDRESSVAKMDAYTEEKRIASERIVENDRIVNENKKSLETSLIEIQNRIDDIKKDWTEGYKKTYEQLWEGKTFEQGIAAQAAHSKEKWTQTIVNQETDYIAQINANNIAADKQPLTDNEVKLFAQAKNEVLNNFQEKIGKLNVDGMKKADADLRLQSEYVFLMIGMRNAMNEAIVEANKSRDANNQMALIKLNVKQIKDFANSLDVKQDMEEIQKNIENHLLLAQLNSQKELIQKASPKTPAPAPSPSSSSSKTAENTQNSSYIIKPKESAGFTRVAYDMDGNTRLATWPESKSVNNIMSQACLAINKEKGQKITMQQEKDLSITFKYNNQTFSFDPKTKEFSGNNIDQETYKMMLKVYDQVYTGQPKDTSAPNKSAAKAVGDKKEVQTEDNREELSQQRKNVPSGPSRKS